MSDEKVEQAVVNVALLHHSMTALNNRLRVVGETNKERNAKKLLNELEQGRKINRSKVELLIPVETPNKNNLNAQRVHEERNAIKQAPEPEKVVISEHVSQSEALHRAMTAKNAPPIAQSGGVTSAPPAPEPILPPKVPTDDVSAPAAPAATTAPVQVQAPSWNGGKPAKAARGTKKG